MDRTDASWCGMETTRAFVGLDVPPLEELRRAVRILGADHPALVSVIDEGAACYRPWPPGAAVDAAQAAVLDGGATPKDATELLAAAPTARSALPVQLTVGPDHCLLRVAHAFGDGWSSVSLLHHLFRQAGSSTKIADPWRVIGPVRRDVLIAGALLARPRAVTTALRKRRSLQGGDYEPQSSRAAALRPTTVHRVVPEAVVRDLRATRDTRWPRASLAAVVLVGLRSSLARELPAPVPGTEVVFDTRRDFAATRDALGNYATGVYVRPEDDLDPLALTRALRSTRESGLPLVAAAASRRPARSPLDRRVAAPTGRPRFSFSFLNGRGAVASLPWRDGQRELVMSNRPNGVDTLSLSCQELLGRLHVSLSFYDEIWPRSVVEDGLDRFAAAPLGSLAQGGAR